MTYSVPSQKTNMASSSRRAKYCRPRSINRSFDTVVSPLLDVIDVCPIFWSTWWGEFNVHLPGRIELPGSTDIPLVLGKSMSNPKIKNGRVIAEKFAISEPTQFRFHYVGEVNRFQVQVIGRVNEDWRCKFPAVVNYDVEEISISGIENDDDDYYCHGDLIGFRCQVSEALATRNIVLHLPKRITRSCLGTNQSEIVLIDLTREIYYKCKILVAPGRKDEKYIVGGWYDFLRDRNLDAGDVLDFHFDNPPEAMFVNVIRRGRA